MQLFLVMKVMNLWMKVMRRTTKNTFHLWKCLCSPIREVTVRLSLVWCQPDWVLTNYKVFTLFTQ